MKIFSYLLLLTLLCILPGNTNADKKLRKKRDSLLVLNRIFNIMPKAWQIFKDMKDVWNILLREPNMDISSAIFRSKEHEMIGRLITISSKLSNLESEVQTSVDTTIVTILQAFPKVVKLELNLHDLKTIINQINFAEDQLRNYLIHGYKNSTPEFLPLNQDTNLENDFAPLEEISSNIMKREANPNWIMEKYTLLDFATWATGHSPNSLLSLLRRTHDLTVSKENNGLFDQILQVSEEPNWKVPIFLKTVTPSTNKIFVISPEN